MAENIIPLLAPFFVLGIVVEALVARRRGARVSHAHTLVSDVGTGIGSQIASFGPLERVLDTPSHHHVHHGGNPEYLDKSYGGIFVAVDRADFTKYDPGAPPAVVRYVSSAPTLDTARQIATVGLVAWYAHQHLAPAAGIAIAAALTVVFAALRVWLRPKAALAA